MAYTIPKTPFTLMGAVYRKIFPAVNAELDFWKKRASAIPDEELKKQALASIETKRFHCLGGAVYALLAGIRWREAITFIVAYQTISDYLDNLCDRSTSLDPADFQQLHEAMSDALSTQNPIQNYYALRQEQSDGEYLADLVRTCQKTMRRLDDFNSMQGHILELKRLYIDLQVHKHVAEEERIPRLVNWFKEETDDTSLYWYEFSAAAGSTLGIFCLISYALNGTVSNDLADKIVKAYFPFVQGLHILLDYFIDQEEDRIEGDLNFCSYYDSPDIMEKRFSYFIEEADHQVQGLPDRHFHEMVNHGLVGLYLGDPKVKHVEGGIKISEDLLRISGYKARFFHWNTKLYYRITKTRR
ncbi:tetraprenyl-beta-curcumene synthase family protein [Lentibacillus persicus]|uniref:tetraprenyl-beta-curcumene synthase family protein n=1 Tax=Lentibacillus persicus TaxID=640948 RepID=UPI002481CC0C|nr:tetraprenyl-beta-curcumene synthase family protein [Lentibacillus persicus]